MNIVFHPQFSWPKSSWWRDVRSWIRHRTVDRYHVVKTGLKPGYYELEDRLLHSMFQLLVDFVESESAWHDLVCNGKITRWMDLKYRWLPWMDYRDAKLGLEHLDWAAGLVSDENSGAHPGDEHYGKPTPQALCARETKALYLWWKDVRPNRPDPMDASGYSQIWEEERGDDQPLWDENRMMIPMSERCSAAAHRSNEIEEQYHAEDEEMMKRLVAIRRSLWT